jgi:hypothetical protein
VVVKELDELGDMSLGDRVVVVFPKVRYDLFGVDDVGGVAVDALERRVGREVGDPAETLAQGLGLTLALSKVDEQVFELVGGIAAEHLRLK